MTRAYYNELDPFAAAWLRELIKANQIAPGEVDARDIRDIQPNELRGFTQCHFFAGIGVWSYALRCAGWPDDRQVWTGSCPCQPFSAAGRRAGTADERHLWPSWYHLIDEHRPVTIFGEQVEAAVRHGWLDLVQDDLERIDYACGAVSSPASGYGAPHLRQRLYFVADAAGTRQLPAALTGTDSGDAGARSRYARPERHSAVGVMGDSIGARLERHAGDGDGIGQPRRLTAREIGSIAATGAVSGFWRDADWILCRDNKYRPVEPGTFPLAHGAPARVGRLRGYGNAIVAPQAQAFIEAFMEWKRGQQ